jgi:hypothetical protein
MTYRGISAKVFHRRGFPIDAKKQPWLGRFLNSWISCRRDSGGALRRYPVIFVLRKKLLVITFSNDDIIIATARGDGVGRIPAMFGQ